MHKESELTLPRDKFDTEAASALVALDWETVKPVVPRILEWVQDGNWPVASVFHPFLIDAGQRLAPFLKPILATDDDTWKYFILANIVRHSQELATALHVELQRLSMEPTASELLEGVSELAQEILAD